MNEEHLAKVNSNSKSKEKIQLSKWREQACFWRQNSNYHRKWREQACFSMLSRWRQIRDSNRMRNICRNGARSEADLAQCGALALPPPFLFLWLLMQFFFSTPPCRNKEKGETGSVKEKRKVRILNSSPILAWCVPKLCETAEGERLLRESEQREGRDGKYEGRNEKCAF